MWFLFVCLFVFFEKDTFKKSIIIFKNEHNFEHNLEKIA